MRSDFLRFHAPKWDPILLWLLIRTFYEQFCGVAVTAKQLSYLFMIRKLVSDLSVFQLNFQNSLSGCSLLLIQAQLNSITKVLTLNLGLGILVDNSFDMILARNFGV